MLCTLLMLVFNTTNFSSKTLICLLSTAMSAAEACVMDAAYQKAQTASAAPNMLLHWSEEPENRLQPCALKLLWCLTIGSQPHATYACSMGVRLWITNDHSILLPHGQGLHKRMQHSVKGNQHCGPS